MNISIMQTRTLLIAVSVISLCLLGGCRSSGSKGLEYGTAIGRVESQKKLADSMWQDLSSRIDRGETPDPRHMRDVGNFALASRRALGLISVDLAQNGTLSTDAKNAITELDQLAADAVKSGGK